MQWMRGLYAKEKYDELLSVFEELFHRNEGQARHYSLAIHVCQKIRDVEKAEAIFSKILEKGFYTVRCFNAMIATYAVAGRYSDAIKLFDDMQTKYKIEPDLKTYTSILSMLNHKKYFDDSVRFWKEIRDKITPNLKIYSSYIYALIAKDMLEETIEVLEEINKLDIKIDDFFLSLFYGQLRRMSPELRQRFFSTVRLRNKNDKSNIVYYNLLIEVTESREEALQLFRDAEINRAVPDVQTYKALIQAPNTTISEAFSTYADMVSKGIEPTDEIFVSLLKVATIPPKIENYNEVKMIQDAANSSGCMNVKIIDVLLQYFVPLQKKEDIMEIFHLAKTSYDIETYDCLANAISQKTGLIDIHTVSSHILETNAFTSGKALRMFLQEIVSIGDRDLFRTLTYHAFKRKIFIKHYEECRIFLEDLDRDAQFEYVLDIYEIAKMFRFKMKSLHSWRSFLFAAFKRETTAESIDILEYGLEHFKNRPDRAKGMYNMFLEILGKGKKPYRAKAFNLLKCLKSTEELNENFVTQMDEFIEELKADEKWKTALQTK